MPSMLLIGRRAAPEIGVVMHHPAAAAVLFLRRARAADDEVVDHIEQRLMALAQVAQLGGPIIHLAIDVHRPLAFPRRIQLLVPDALQIGRLRTRTAAGDQEITAILKMQRGQRRIAFEAGQTSLAPVADRSAASRGRCSQGRDSRGERVCDGRRDDRRGPRRSCGC